MLTSLGVVFTFHHSALVGLEGMEIGAVVQRIRRLRFVECVVQPRRPITHWTFCYLVHLVLHVHTGSGDVLPTSSSHRARSGSRSDIRKQWGNLVWLQEQWVVGSKGMWNRSGAPSHLLSFQAVIASSRGLWSRLNLGIQLNDIGPRAWAWKSQGCVCLSTYTIYIPGLISNRLSLKSVDGQRPQRNNDRQAYLAKQVYTLLTAT
jgi:hypothetical protein